MPVLTLAGRWPVRFLRALSCPAQAESRGTLATRHTDEVSAGILLYRRRGEALELLIAHPGGPFWAGKDAGAWTLPKGEGDEGETDDAGLLAVARREFREETGQDAPAGPATSLGSVKLRSGKVVHGWALEGDLDPASSVSTTIEIDWPPRSGRRLTHPEIDQVAWVAPDAARTQLNPAQAPFVDRLQAALATARH